MALVFIADFFVFLFGLCIGSFLNCVIYRTELQANMPAGPEKKAVSFLRGKSFCPHCKRVLSWADLIPVFSFLFLFGKCRYCKKKISWQYPLVEIATGIIFLLIFNQFGAGVIPGLTRNPGTSQALWIPAFAGMTVYLAFLFYIASALIIIFVYDFKHYLIPDKVLFPAIFITLIYRLVEALWIPAFAGMTILGAIVASGFFLIIFLISAGRWMGFGDVKLAILMGLLLGFQNVLVALFLAFFLGAVIGTAGLILPFDSAQGGKKKTLKSEIPFGPFLIIGTFLALFYGEKIIQWYLQILRV